MNGDWINDDGLGSYKISYQVMGTLIAGMVILTIICICWHATMIDEYLYGFWIATDAFCEAGDVDSIMMFIGPRDGWVWPTRRGYLLIEPNICNQGFTMQYSAGWTVTGTFDVSAKMVFDDISPWDSDNVHFLIDFQRGTMKIVCDVDGTGPIVCGDMTKCHETTNLTLDMEKNNDSL